MPFKLSGVIRPTYWVVLVNESQADRPENWRVIYVSNGMQSETQAEKAAIASPNWPATCLYRIMTRTKAQRRYSAAWQAWAGPQPSYPQRRTRHA